MLGRFRLTRCLFSSLCRKPQRSCTEIFYRDLTKRFDLVNLILHPLNSSHSTHVTQLSFSSLHSSYSPHFTCLTHPLHSTHSTHPIHSPQLLASFTHHSSAHSLTRSLPSLLTHSLTRSLTSVPLSYTSFFL